eukprot:symbB.v1.2.013739.t1/scaffold901.1/size153659/2
MCQSNPRKIAYNQRLNTLARGSAWQEALLLLSQLPKATLRGDVVAYTAAIHACHHGPWPFVVSLFDELRSNALQLDIIACGAAIAGLAWPSGLGLLKDLPQLTIQVDMVTFNGAIHQCATSTAWPWSLTLLQRQGPPGSLRGIHAAMAFSPWWTAQEVLREATQIQLQRNVVSFSSLMPSPSMPSGTTWMDGAALLELTKISSVQPNVVMFGALISACEKEGAWRFASHLWSNADAAELSASVPALGAVLSCMEKAEEWSQALDLWMRKQRPMVASRRDIDRSPSRRSARAGCEDLHGEFVESTLVSSCLADVEVEARRFAGRCDLCRIFDKHL